MATHSNTTGVRDGSMSEQHHIGEMSITDEHEVLDVNTKMKTLVAVLGKNPASAMLLRDKLEGIVGVITSEDIQEAMQRSKNIKRLKPSEVMRTGLLQVPEDTPLEEALALIDQQQPDAVIVQNENGGFAGFFSPNDYGEASDVLAQRQHAQQRFNQKAGEFHDDLDELMEMLLADNEDLEEEEIVADTMQLSSEPISFEDEHNPSND